MKTKMSVLMCLFVIGVFFLSLGYSSTQSSGPLSKIGTVDIETVSVQCEATKAYTEKLKADIQKMTNEEDKLNASIKALETELDSGALKIGSQDFFDRNRELAQKKAQLSYLQDFNKQEQGLKNQLWKMDLYKKILKVTNDIGKEKNMGLVLAVEEPDLSPQRADDFANVVRAHRVLYSAGCVDLTNEVIERLNKETKAGN
jgi:Skp family chaperone for outer membrane proteins